MKIQDFRKYIFANIIAMWFYYFVYINTPIVKSILFINYPVSDYTIVPWIAMNLFYCSILGIMFLFMILEILIRKFLIEKYFPNFGLNIHIKFLKPLVIIYNILFLAGFITASVLFLIFLITLIIVH